MADLKVKSKLRAQGGVSLPAETASRALTVDGSGNVASSSVTTTELGYMSGVTSAVQTQLNAKASNAQVNFAPTNTLFVAKNGLDTNTGGELNPFLTISAAISAATSGTTIFIMPGSYAENITLVAGVSLQGQQARSVVITGNMTAAFAGTVYLHSLDLQASSGVVLTQSGASSTNLQIHDCHIHSLSGASHGISYTNTNSASRLDFETGVITVAVSTSARCFNSSATAAGSIIFNYVSSRLLDTINNTCLTVAGSLTFNYTLNNVRGQIVVANTASFIGVNLTCQTTTAAIFTTTSSVTSWMNNIVVLSGANPCFAGTGLFAHGLIGFPSTGEGFASTLNGGAGAAPIPTSSFQLHPEVNTTSPFDGQINYNGTNLFVTIGSTRYQLDRQSTGTNTGDQIASTVPNTPSGNLAATNVQAALNELQTDVDSRILTTAIGIANGVASLDVGGKIPSAQLPSTVMEYKGNWDASANSPTLADGTGDTGDVYRTSVAGTRNLGSGSQVFAVGDWVVYNGTIWQLSPNSNAVGSVFGRVGTVVATSGDYTATQITNTPSGNLAAVTVQAALNELQTDVDTRATSTALTTHISNATGAHAASAISNTPSGNLVATTVQAALNELQTDVDTRATATALTTHISNATGAHAASAISVVPAGNLTSTTVQAALQEIQTEVDTLLPGSAGDIKETSFSIANNQAVAANVTGLAFASGVVRGFKALVSVRIDGTADLYETFELLGINKAGSFDMAVNAVGDESGLVFTITSAGQVQYTSANYAGFVTGVIKFRAETVTV